MNTTRIMVSPSGKYVDVMNVRPQDVEILDIAHHLAQQCRFTGGTRHFYSVAQHSVIVAWLVELWGGTLEQQQQALLHDGSEYLMGDLSSPMKQFSELGEIYRQVESLVMPVVAGKFGVQYPMDPIVKRADVSVLHAERDQLMPKADHSKAYWPRRTGPKCEIEIERMGPAKAERLFMREYGRLFGSAQL